MVLGRLSIFLYLFWTSKFLFALDLSLAFTNVSSIDDSNLDEIKIIYRCHKTTSGLLTLSESIKNSESKACGEWEQKAWYKAKEYCEKKNLELNEISRAALNSPSVNTICSNGNCSSGSYGDNEDTEIKFKCYKESLIDKNLEKVQQRIKEEHAALQSNNSDRINQTISSLIRMECNGKTRDILEIGDEFIELFNTSSLSKTKMIYDQKNYIIKSQDLKVFRFNDKLTSHLKFSNDIAQNIISINQLVIYDDKNKKIATQCSYK